MTVVSSSSSSNENIATQQNYHHTESLSSIGATSKNINTNGSSSNIVNEANNNIDEEIMDDELMMDMGEEPKTPSPIRSPNRLLSLSQERREHLIPIQPNNILDVALSPPHRIHRQEEVPNFLILGRKIKSRATDPPSTSLYGFARAWFLAHTNQKLPETQNIYHTSNSSFFASGSYQPSNGHSTRNVHSEMLAEQAQKKLIYKSGTEMFEKMNENRRKIQKKKTLLADLKRWAKQRKMEYLQFHKDRAKIIQQQIEMRINGYINMEDSPNRSTNMNNEAVNLLCEEE